MDGRINARGRPAGQMTRRRQQMLAAYQQAASEGQPIRLARMARECGLHSYNDARRILTDLKRLGLAN